MARTNSFTRGLCLAGLALGLAGGRAADWYVAPEGTTAGPGTPARPYSLTAALSGRVGRPGDTFWLRGGTYALGHVDTQVEGAPGRPLTFRQMPGERARVDGSLTTWNSSGHVIFRDFELFSSDANRVSSQTGVGFHPTDIKIRAGISCFSPNFSFINLVIHDQTRHGIYMSRTSDNCLVYGCVIYNNGWCAPDNAEGHSLYIQGTSGTREIAENLLFNSAGYGLHVYDNSGHTLAGMVIEGNVSFNAGAIQRARRQRDWTVGVDAPSKTCDGIVFRNNMGYHPPGLPNYPQAQLGRQKVNGSIIVTGNYLPVGLALNNWRTATVHSNFFGPGCGDGLVTLDQSRAALRAAWDWNTYAGAAGADDFRWNGSASGFADWKRRTGYDANSVYTPGTPRGTKVFVRPNRYEAGRANVVVYNWDNLDAVAVDVSAVLPVGAAYEVRNAEDFFAAPVLSGTYDGKALRLPMSRLTVARINGALLTPPPTGPTFNVFVLLPARGRVEREIRE